MTLTQGKVSLHARAPFCCSTYTAIQATCNDACAFKAGGCYAAAGITGIVSARLDQESIGLSSENVIAEEVRAIDESFGGGQVPQDGARGGRDLRLHVAGDAGNEQGAEMLAGAEKRWRARGGGDVWTYTHSWRSIKREAWGSISVLASVETPAHVEEARARNYVPALVVDRFPKKNRVFEVAGTRFIPCPAETAQMTCTECRLCFDDEKLFARGDGIAFQVHGRDGTKAKRKLDVLNERGQMGFAGF